MYDALIIGSGFGGAMAAHRLVRAGWRVLLLERGDWVPRGPSARDPRATMVRTPQYSNESAYHCVSGGDGEEIGGIFCVGGPSVFYGAASFRMREEDFRPGPEVVNGSNARWPFGYDALEPYYGEAERLLGVAGDDSGDPTRPPRRDPYPFQPPPFAPISRRFRDSALELGLHPFPIPLAINFSRQNGRPPCDACRQCDTYICAIQAKNDADVAVIAPLRQQGLERSREHGGHAPGRIRKANHGRPRLGPGGSTDGVLQRAARHSRRGCHGLAPPAARLAGSIGSTRLAMPWVPI